MATQADIKRYLANLNDERNAGVLYRALAEGERDPRLAELYRRLAATEDGHADVWAQHLKDEGVAPAAFAPSWRTRVLSWFAHRYGPGPWTMFGPMFLIMMMAVCVVVMFFMMRRRHGATPGDAAAQILKERYARGEIDKAEYEERRRTLEG